VAPSNAYPCSDGKLVLIAGNKDEIYARLMEALGEPERAKDPRFATHVERGKRVEEVDDHIAAWTSQRTSEEVLKVMNAFAIPAGPINTAAEMVGDPHFQAREAIVSVDDPTYGRMRTHGVFPKLSETPGTFGRTGPALGEHNEAVYGEWLGHGAAQLADWRERGVI
jgi:crotonobetainyl-CoA:carnitine CoA-transferase CaiB-like acyl-CoA transferase